MTIARLSRHRIFEYASSALLSLSGVVLIALQHPFGWLLLGMTAVCLLGCRHTFAKEMLLLVIAIGILGVTPITTDISVRHILIMGATLSLAVALPYLLSRFVYGDYLVRFRFHHGRAWYHREILYILFTISISYVLLPFFLRTTGSYRYWTVTPGASAILRLFVGTNALGIWDELFFVSTVLGILRRFFPFLFANAVQAVLFTSFLYELGFRGWGWIMIAIFALIQGEVFRQTDSLFFVITIHLCLDFVLFLALIAAHHPDWMPIFVT